MYTPTAARTTAKRKNNQDDKMRRNNLHLNITQGVIFSSLLMVLFLFFFPASRLMAGQLPTAQDSPEAVELNEESTLSDYLAYAALHNPGLKAAFYRWQAALARIPYVRALPQPQLTFAYFIREIETRVGPQRGKVGIKQMFPWFDKPKLRGSAAEAFAEAEKHRFDAQKLALFYRVKQAYFEHYFVLRTVALLKESAALLKDREAALESKYRTGSASYAALLKLQVEIDKLEERRQSAAALLIPVKAALNAVLNRFLDAPLAEPRINIDKPRFFSTQLENILKKNNPALKSSTALIEKAKIDLKLAKRNYLPDFSLGVDYMITGETAMPGVPDSGKDPLAVMVSIHLPVWLKKNRAAVGAADNRFLAALNRKQEEENKLLSRLQMVVYRFRDAERKMALYKDKLLPRAKQALEVTRSAFETGSSDFLDFIDSQRTLLHFELEYERARTDSARGFAEIEMLTGKHNPKEKEK